MSLDFPLVSSQTPKSFAAHIGIESSMSDTQIVTLLAEYFRGFIATPLPSQGRTDNLYLDIALSGIGVCRHRAIAFVLTANALGVPARYVHNEAHAFAEVEFATGGWRRIDLGGAAEGLQIHGDPDLQSHTPQSDALPRPEGFEQNYSAAPSDATRRSYVESDASPTASQQVTQLSDLNPRNVALGSRQNSLPIPVLSVVDAPARVYRGDEFRVAGNPYRGTRTSFRRCHRGVSWTGIAKRPLRSRGAPRDRHIRGLRGLRRSSYSAGNSRYRPMAALFRLSRK